MARRAADKILDAVVVNNDTDTSESVPLNYTWGFAVQAIWTGASTTGTVKLQASVNGEDWEDVAGASEAVAGPGSAIWNVVDVFYAHMRVSIEETATEDLTVNAWFSSKGV